MMNSEMVLRAADFVVIRGRLIAIAMSLRACGVAEWRTDDRAPGQRSPASLSSPGPPTRGLRSTSALPR